LGSFCVGARRLIGQAFAPGGAGELNKISCPARSTLFELVASLFTQSVQFSCVAIGFYPVRCGDVSDPTRWRHARATNYAKTTSLVTVTTD
jgi:hypothetical protein